MKKKKVNVEGLALEILEKSSIKTNLSVFSYWKLAVWAAPILAQAYLDQEDSILSLKSKILNCEKSDEKKDGIIYSLLKQREKLQVALSKVREAIPYMPKLYEEIHCWYCGGKLYLKGKDMSVEDSARWAVDGVYKDIEETKKIIDEAIGKKGE